MRGTQKIYTGMNRPRRDRGKEGKVSGQGAKQSPPNKTSREGARRTGDGRVSPRPCAPLAPDPAQGRGRGVRGDEKSDPEGVAFFRGMEARIGVEPI